MAGTAAALTLGAGSSLNLQSANRIASTTFTGASETPVLGAPAQFASVISGFVAGDTVDVQNVVAPSAAFANGTLTLYAGTNGQGSVVSTPDFVGKYAAAAFAVASDPMGGTDVTLAAAPDHDFTRPEAAFPAGWDRPHIARTELAIPLHLGR